MNDHLKLLPYINKKLKLGLDIRGNQVYSAGRMLSSTEVKTIFENYYPLAKEMLIHEMMIEKMELEKVDGNN